MEDADDRRGGMLPDLGYWVWVFRRRFWLFAVVAALMAGGGLGVALVLPPVYEARASMLVESQQIPTDLVRSTVGASAIEQIEVVKQRLLTREILLDLADRHRVFADAGDMTPTERVNRMRTAIRFDTRVLGDGRGARAGESVAISFSIAFRGDDGGRAAAVVNDLVTRVLSQSAELRRGRAQTTSDYFRQEVDRLGGELARAEARIVAFQDDNREALPESLAYRRTQLDLVQERLQRFELTRVDLQQELASLQMALGEGADPEAAPLPPLTETARELAGLRRTLMQRRTILTDDHPDIRNMELYIKALEAVVAAEAATEGEAEALVPLGRRDAATIRAEAAVRELRRRATLTEARIAFNEEQIVELADQRDALERSLLATPNVQMEFANLQRAHETFEARYRVALAKLAEAEAGEQLEDKQQGERFEVIEAATVPDEPVAPNRKAYAVLGAAGGVGGGLGLIVLLEMMSGVVRRPEDLVRLGREPAAVIPYIATAGERRWLWTRRIAVALLLAGGVAGGLWALHTYHLPLEILWAELLERFGVSGALDLVRRRVGV